MRLILNMQELKQELRIFLEEIHGEYEWILYETNYKTSYGEEVFLGFPYCCDVSAQLIGAFLVAHGYTDVKCLYCNLGKKRHYWCEYDGYIFDYTDIQFGRLKEEDIVKIDKHCYAKEDFIKVISSFTVIFTPVIGNGDNHSCGFCGFIDKSEIPLMFVENARCYEFNKNGFFEFVRDFVVDVKQKCLDTI